MQTPMTHAPLISLPAFFGRRNQRPVDGQAVFQAQKPARDWFDAVLHMPIAGAPKRPQLPAGSISPLY